METDVQIFPNKIFSIYYEKDVNKNILTDACFRTHQIFIYAYQLLILGLRKNYPYSKHIFITKYIMLKELYE